MVVSVSGVKSEVMPNQHLSEELDKPVTRKFEKRKVYSYSKDNIQRAYLVDMQLIRTFNKGFYFFISVVDICNKYVWLLI